MSKKFTTRDELEDKYGQLMFDCECYLENSIEIVLNYLDSIKNNSNFYEAKEVVSIVLGNLADCIENLICFERKINKKAYPELNKYQKDNAHIIDDDEEEDEENEENEEGDEEEEEDIEDRKNIKNKENKEHNKDNYNNLNKTKRG